MFSDYNYSTISPAKFLITLQLLCAKNLKLQLQLLLNLYLITNPNYKQILIEWESQSNKCINGG